MSRDELEALIRSYARQYGVPEDLALAVARIESGLNPQAVSPAGAIGIMQLMPQTASMLGVDPWDPIQNIEGGIRYLAQLYHRFGNWEHALAAYNAGPTRVERVIAGIERLPAETLNYVGRILASLIRPSETPAGAPTNLPGILPVFAPAMILPGPVGSSKVLLIAATILILGVIVLWSKR